jgi:hypothetical protein
MGIYLHGAHWIRVSRASCKASNLFSKSQVEVRRDFEFEHTILIALATTCRLLDWNDNGCLTSFAIVVLRKDPNVNLEFGSVWIIPSEWHQAFFARFRG